MTRAVRICAAFASVFVLILGAAAEAAPRGKQDLFVVDAEGINYDGRNRFVQFGDPVTRSTFEVKVGRTVKLTFGVVNTARGADDVTIKGCRSRGGFRVRWFDVDGNRITEAVIDGSHVLSLTGSGDLAGSSDGFDGKVYAASRVDQDDVLRCRVRAKSSRNANDIDVVLAIIRART